jgi:hypothetical protein
MSNTPSKDVKVKHRKRKDRLRRNSQESIILHAKKKTLEKLKDEGKLPKLAFSRI